MSYSIKDCENQVMLFFKHLDDRQYDALIALLTPQCAWRRQGKVLATPAEALAALQQRSATMRIAHIMTNLACTAIDEQRCTLHGYMLVVRHDPGKVVQGPVPLDGIESVRRVQATLERHENVWLINELSAEDILFSTNA
jgi:hypothetical protein